MTYFVIVFASFVLALNLIKRKKKVLDFQAILIMQLLTMIILKVTLVEVPKEIFYVLVIVFLTINITNELDGDQHE
ncbi:hypothetical protein OAT67_03805 [Bacteriovoracaceae bacterium]|nr:hypothetical protein [Bacteriovoracaceae bacterium]|tara:strand:+ start:151013 stop:151240 length:228 start_codon:yes stop_codon:yes gene_type:complete